MRIRVLGCSGGIGAGLHTTGFLIQERVLLDAGTGVGRLPLAELARIAHVFLSHAHLDHIAALPLLLDTRFGQVREPLTVWGPAAVLEDLRRHVFNWRIWPDFAALPDRRAPALRYRPIERDETVEPEPGLRLTALPAAHTVPACGYLVEGEGRRLAYSGDSGANPAFWRRLDALDRLDALIIECAFPQAQAGLAARAGHHCPASLAADLARLRHRPRIWLTHLKPGEEATILAECRGALAGRRWRALRDGETLRL
ncbi:MAG: cAMP phosphodiesterase class-II:metallo-beta-lactamase superfamily protein [Gammaproteobacteria bacterium]|nr:MAG: cAMP phosphodiesterase class-II:metallo-beta-lactamase superfamily protein [Gammaproteobacteria bacterium]